MKKKGGGEGREERGGEGRDPAPLSPLLRPCLHFSFFFAFFVHMGGGAQAPPPGDPCFYKGGCEGARARVSAHAWRGGARGGRECKLFPRPRRRPRARVWRALPEKKKKKSTRRQPFGWALSLSLSLSLCVSLTLTRSLTHTHQSVRARARALPLSLGRRPGGGVFLERLPTTTPTGGRPLHRRRHRRSRHGRRPVRDGAGGGNGGHSCRRRGRGRGGGGPDGEAKVL